MINLNVLPNFIIASKYINFWEAWWVTEKKPKLKTGSVFLN